MTQQPLQPPDKKLPLPPDRKTQEALFQVFQAFALEDQRKYYTASSRRFRKAAGQVNFYRALFALLAGLASAAAALIVGTTSTSLACRLDFVSASTFVQSTPAVTAPGDFVVAEATPADAAAAQSGCFNTRAFVFLLVILTIVAPAVGAAFTTLGDIYQWDRMVTIYDGALENLEVADARSPLPEMDDLVYRASLRAYAEGTLMVMRDETAQWGQLTKTPERLEKFIDEERQKAAQYQGSADDLNVDHPPAPPPATG